MSVDEINRLWLIAKILHEARRNLAWGQRTNREPWPETSHNYTHSPVAYVDLALEQAKAISHLLKG